MVFSGLYPIEKSEFEILKIAIEKLTLNDSSVTVAMETRYLSQYFLNILSKLNNKSDAILIYLSTLYTLFFLV